MKVDRPLLIIPWSNYYCAFSRFLMDFVKCPCTWKFLKVLENNCGNIISKWTICHFGTYVDFIGRVFRLRRNIHLKFGQPTFPCNGLGDFSTGWTVIGAIQAYDMHYIEGFFYPSWNRFIDLKHFCQALTWPVYADLGKINRLGETDLLHTSTLSMSAICYNLFHTRTIINRISGPLKKREIGKVVLKPKVFLTVWYSESMFFVVWSLRLRRIECQFYF